MNVASPTLLREKEAREVYALLKCSVDEYDKALEMAQKMAAGDVSMPGGPHGSKKIVLAAGALQDLLLTPGALQDPLLTQGALQDLLPTRRFHRHDRVLIPGASGTVSSNEQISLRMTTAISPMLYGIVHFLA